MPFRELLREYPGIPRVAPRMAFSLRERIFQNWGGSQVSENRTNMWRKIARCPAEKKKKTECCHVSGCLFFCYKRETQKNPRAHKNKIGTLGPPPPKPPPPLKGGILRTQVFLQKESFFSRCPKKNWRSHFRPQNCGH